MNYEDWNFTFVSSGHGFIKFLFEYKTCFFLEVILAIFSYSVIVFKILENKLLK